MRKMYKFSKKLFQDIVVPKTCPGYYFLETLLELDEFVGELGSSYLRNYEGHEENVETL